MTDMIPADPASPAGGALAEDAGVAAERERLARQLRETRMQLAMTETRLAALEQSSTMKFGRTIANAAKKPWPRGALLPRDLFRLWKDRAAPKSGAKNAATALAAAQLADLSGTGGRFLSSLTAPGVLALADPALTLAGGLSAGSAAPGRAWSSRARSARSAAPPWPRTRSSTRCSRTTRTCCSRAPAPTWC